jgi:hypothetical protein
MSTEQQLLKALKDLERAYVSLTVRGYERITELGGECDEPEVMLRGDPYLTQARDAIARATS